MRQRLLIVIVGVAVGLVGRMLFPPSSDEAVSAHSAEAVQAMINEE